MSVFDVRCGNLAEIDVIRFADDHDNGCGDQASSLRKSDEFGALEIVEDGNCDYVRIRSRDHAELLIQALEKAIDLKWVE